MRAETQILSGDVVSINMRILEIQRRYRDVIARELPGAGVRAVARHLHPGNCHPALCAPFVPGDLPTSDSPFAGE